MGYMLSGSVAQTRTGAPRQTATGTIEDSRQRAPRRLVGRFCIGIGESMSGSAASSTPDPRAVLTAPPPPQPATGLHVNIPRRKAARLTWAAVRETTDCVIFALAGTVQCRHPECIPIMMCAASDGIERVRATACMTR